MGCNHHIYTVVFVRKEKIAQLWKRIPYKNILYIYNLKQTVPMFFWLSVKYVYIHLAVIHHDWDLKTPFPLAATTKYRKGSAPLTFWFSLLMRKNSTISFIEFLLQCLNLFFQANFLVSDHNVVMALFNNGNWIQFNDF